LFKGEINTCFTGENSCLKEDKAVGNVAHL